MIACSTILSCCVFTNLKIISNNVSNSYFMTSYPILHDILHQFYVLLSSLTRRNDVTWLYGWFIVVVVLVVIVFEVITGVGGEDKHSFHMIMLYHTAWHPNNPLSIVLLKKYDALCMLTTQHSILHFTASLWNDMPQEKIFL